MRRLLLTTSALSPLLVAAPALAQTSISTARITPVVTATVNNGAPSDVTITTAGSVKVSSGTAVTLNSANSVKNDGTIQITDANDATGIAVAPGGTGTITNTGKIIIDETYTQTDSDNDGDKDGLFATGQRRFGIRTADDAAFTGSIVNSGTITIEGNNSGGIRLGGALAGSLTNTGEVTVVGNDSIAIRTGAVSGNVVISGNVGAQGANSVAIALDGDVAGKAVFQGNVVATGYRATTAPADPSKLDADDLLQGGSAIRIAGNVGGGILFDAPPANNDPNDADEDDDGTPDANESTATVTSFGSAPTVSIGSAERDLVIGKVAGDAGNHSVVIKGGIAGNGVYAGVDATGLAVGGQGHAVDLGGGISIAGTVGAGSKANATAVRIGAGSTMAGITVGGQVLSQGGGDAAHMSRGISIAAGATVPKLRVDGKIVSATASSGTATAVLDSSGTLTQIENKGAVVANGAALDTGRAIAFDLRANTTGVTLKQLAVTGTAAAPLIEGNVLFGSGNDLFDVADGTVTGNVDFGAGANTMALSGDAAHAGKLTFGAGNDALTLAGTSKVIGNVEFGGGDDSLALASGTLLRGTLSGSAGVAANVAGTLDVTNTGNVALGTLNVASTGVIGVNINAAGNNSTKYVVGGAATFADGSKLLVHLNGIGTALGSFTVVQAGSLTGADKLTTTGTVLPFLFKSSLSTNQAAGTITLKIDKKSAGELGLNRSEASAYDAIFNVLDKDSNIASTFLAIGDQETLRARFGTFLPEHAGGLFESVTQASRASMRFLEDRAPQRVESGGDWNVWLQQYGWGTSKDLGDTAAYDVGGWGASGGVERALGGFGRIGLTLGFGLGRDADGSNDNEVTTGQYEASVHWRARFDGLGLAARAGIGKVDFHGQRRFDANGFNRVAKAEWGAMLYSAGANVSYQLDMGRFHLRPLASIDYYRLNEDGYQEDGGGAAFDLAVAERKSDELAASGTLTAGYDLGSLEPEGTWIRVELEGGRREIVGGTIGSTTAQFATGNPFTLDPEERKSGWLGRVRVSGGRELFSIGGEAGAEEQQGHAAVSARMSVKIGW